MKVTDRTGQTWRVTRRWVPWRRRLKGWGARAGDLLLTASGDVLGLILLPLLVLVAVPVVVLAVLGLAELLVLLLVLPFALAARVLLGRDWTVEARRGFRVWWQDAAGDWQASGSRIREVAAAIEAGRLPERNVGVDPGPAPVPTPGTTGA